MGIIWTIVLGFVAGVIAKFIMPGSSNEPSGFVLTTILGVVGAFVASYLGQALDGIPPAKVPGSSAPSSVPLSFSLSGDSSPSGACRKQRHPDFTGRPHSMRRGSRERLGFQREKA